MKKEIAARPDHAAQEQAERAALALADPIKQVQALQTLTLQSMGKIVDQLKQTNAKNKSDHAELDGRIDSALSTHL